MPDLKLIWRIMSAPVSYDTRTVRRVSAWTTIQARLPRSSSSGNPPIYRYRYCQFGLFLLLVRWRIAFLAHGLAGIRSLGTGFMQQSYCSQTFGQSHLFLRRGADRI